MGVFQSRDFELFMKAASHFAKLWNIQDKPVFINDSENIVYKFENTDVILRLTENTHRTSSQIKKEANFIKYLNLYVPEVVEVIPSNRNKFIETEIFRGYPIHATVFKKAQGEWVEGTQKLKNSLPSQLGSLTSKIHYFGKRHKSNRSEYISNDHIKNYKYYLKEDNEIREMEKALSWYHRLPKTKDSFGLIHGDIHFGNFFYTDKKEITLFDFDDFSNGFFLFDIGIHLYYALGMFTFHGEINHYENYKAKYLSAYKSHNQLDPKWFNYIDEVIRFRTIDLYAWMNKMYASNDLSPKQENMFRIYRYRINKVRDLNYRKF